MAGLTSLPRKKNIKGQPHKLAYITEAESDLLKLRGGAGKPMEGTKGVPAYYSDAAGDGDTGDVGSMGGGDEGDQDGYSGDMIDEDWGGYPTGMPGDVPEAGFSGTDLGIIGIPGYSAPPDSLEGSLDQLYGKLRAQGKFKTRGESYADFAEKTGGMYDSWFDSFKTMFDLQQKFGYAPLNTVLNTHGIPVTHSYGYLTMANPEEEEYENRRSRRREYLLPYRKTLDGSNTFDAVSFPGMDMLMDPVIQDVMFSPEPEYDNRKYYTEAVREASQAMTPEERYGVLDPTIAFDDPLYGTRIGGYLPTLEESGLPTYMGGFRGSRETDAPFALTSTEADRYQEIFMAFDGTKGGAIRAEIDSAKPGQTVEDALTEAGLSSYGLPREAEASSLANYMDREALKGWFQGLGIVTSMGSPFMPASAMGLPQEIFEDTVKPALNTIREKLDENIPGFKDLSAKFDVGVDKVKEQYENEVPETETILDTVFDAIMGEGKSQQAKEFGSNYQLPSGVREAIEVGVEDIAPDFTGAEMAFFDPDDIGNPYAGLTNPELEAQLAFEASRRGLDSADVPTDIGGVPSEVFIENIAPQPFRQDAQPETAEFARNALADLEYLGLVEDPPPFREALPGEVQPETIALLTGQVPELSAGVAAPVTPVEIQQLAPLPEEVDIAQAAFTEPPVVETVSEVSPDAMNAALNIISNMINQPGSVVSTDDYLAIQNAETEEEFVEAIQKVIDKDRERGRQLEKESGFVYKRGN